MKSSVNNDRNQSIEIASVFRLESRRIDLLDALRGGDGFLNRHVAREHTGQVTAGYPVFRADAACSARRVWTVRAQAGPDPDAGSAGFGQDGSARRDFESCSFRVSP